MWKLTLGMLVLVGVALVAVPVSANMIEMERGDPSDDIPDLVYDPPVNALYFDTLGAAVNGYILTSEAGIFTGGEPQDLDVIPLFPATNTEFEKSKQFIGGMVGYAGNIYFGNIIGEEHSGVDLFADLTMTYTVVGEAGIKVPGLVVIPEPSTLLLLAMGLVGLLVVRRRR